jgi:hypothetical protein
MTVPPDEIADLIRVFCQEIGVELHVDQATGPSATPAELVPLDSIETWTPESSPVQIDINGVRGTFSPDVDGLPQSTADRNGVFWQRLRARTKE